MNASGPTPAAAYVAKVGDVRRDRAAVLAVWRGNLGREDRVAAKYDWFYLGCPWGEPLLSVLHHEPTATVVGVAAAGPRRMLANGAQLTAGVLVDMAVATEHRSLGPALTLQKAMMAAGGERFDFLYGFPNAKAAPVFKRVGYSQLIEIVRYARVLRYGGHLARVMPRPVARPLGWLLDGAASARRAIVARRGEGARWTSRWVDSAGPEIDQLWARSEHGAEPIAIRDRAMLQWRFDAAPLPKTRYLLVSDAKSGELHAWFACQADGAMMHVRDFWSIDAAAGIGRSLIDALVGAVRREGHAVLSVEYAGPVQRRAAWLDAGFVARSRRPVFAKWKSASTGGNDRAEIHLTSADEDE